MQTCFESGNGFGIFLPDKIRVIFLFFFPYLSYRVRCLLQCLYKGGTLWDSFRNTCRILTPAARKQKLSYMNFGTHKHWKSPTLKPRPQTFEIMRSICRFHHFFMHWSMLRFFGPKCWGRVQTEGRGGSICRARQLSYSQGLKYGVITCYNSHL